MHHEELHLARKIEHHEDVVYGKVSKQGKWTI
jgi:hypothetical protein